MLNNKIISINDMNIPVCISLNQKTLKEVDKNRGLVSRSAWINHILNKNLRIDSQK